MGYREWHGMSGGVMEKLVLATDNPNTHTPACLYKTFLPEPARRIAEQIAWHYMPKHGS
jgi:hypothetical protein